MQKKIINILPARSLNFPLCLAPMVGLSHVALRQVVRSYMPTGARTIWPTEMLNSRRIPNEDLSTTPQTLRADDEDGLVPQILGNEEEFIVDSVRILKEWGAEGIDINMGCPVQKALRHNYGVALMGDVKYAAEVVGMAVRSSDLPVSVKLRAVGSTKNISELLDFVGALRDAGASWICLHPRTAEQKRRGSADWEQIRQLKASVDFPIIGNGDVQTTEDAKAMLSETGCDMVMAGRALAARPWMMWQLGEEMGFAPPPGREGETAPRTPLEEGAEYGRALLAFIDHAAKVFPPELALRKIRFYVKTTGVWIPFGQTLGGLCHKAQNVEQLKELLHSFFQADIEMSPRTELRQ